MNSMMAAINKRKHGGQTVMGDHGSMSHASQHTDDADQNVNHGKDLHGLVASLSDDEKLQLKGILDGKGKGDIEKGAPSSDEKGKIAEQMQVSNAQNEGDKQAAEGSVDSDAIGKSMLDSRYLGSNPPTQARNLSDRVKMDIHKKLKGKGKI